MRDVTIFLEAGLNDVQGSRCGNEHNSLVPKKHF